MRRQHFLTLNRGQDNKGQSVVEYFVLFTIIALLTLLSLSAFYPRVYQASEDAFQDVLNLSYMH